MRTCSETRCLSSLLHSLPRSGRPASGAQQQQHGRGRRHHGSVRPHPPALVSPLQLLRAAAILHALVHPSLQPQRMPAPRSSLRVGGSSRPLYQLASQVQRAQVTPGLGVAVQRLNHVQPLPNGLQVGQRPLQPGLQCTKVPGIAPRLRACVCRCLGWQPYLTLATTWRAAMSRLPLS